MASFTDNIQALSTFNPYVEQQPVDAMVKVGMQKQHLYDEGYRKIQASVDQVAGLDVIRDVDKGYLQSKLNSLGNNLKAAAAGDFSNYQLTNSLAGMASKVGNDEIILNAVSSSKKYKQGLSEMNSARKEGKSNASNEWLYGVEANEWLNNGDVTAQFTSTFKPYTNYKKNAQEVIKGLAKEVTENDVAFTYDANGNITSVLDAITRTKISEITPRRIQEALKVGLSTSDWQQLQIDGRYQYSNESPESFMNRINTTYKTHINEYSQQKEDLINALSTTTNIKAQQKIKDQIEQMDAVIENATTDYKSIASTFASGDTETAKARLFTNNWVDSFSKTFSAREYSQTQQDNPSASMAMRREEKRQAWLIHQQDLQQREDFHQDDVSFKMLDLEQKKLANTLKAKEIGGYGPVLATIDKADAPDITFDKVIATQSQLEYAINKEKNDIIAQFRGEMNPSMSLNEKRDKIKRDEKWLRDQIIAYNNNPNSFTGDASLASSLAELDRMDQKHLGNEAVIAGLENEANANPATPPLEKLIPADARSLSFVASNGRTVTLSPKDFVSYNEKKKELIKLETSPVGGIAGHRFNDALARQVLSPQEYKIYEVDKKYVTRKPLTKGEQIIADNRSTYFKTVNEKYRKNLDARKEFIGNRLKEKVGMIQGEHSGIPLGTPQLKDSFGGALIGWAKNAEDLTGLANSPDVTKESLIEIASKLKTASVQVVPATEFSPAYQNITVISTDNKTNTFRMPIGDYQSVFRGQFDPSPEVKAFMPYKQQMVWTGKADSKYATTALDNNFKTNTKNSYLRPTNFSNVKAYTVSGNVVEGNKGSGNYQLRLNVYDPVTKKTIVEDYPFPIGTFMDESKIVPTMERLNDNTIFQLLHGKTASPAELKKLKEASEQQ